jgi:hypothetical protein
MNRSKLVVPMTLAITSILAVGCGTEERVVVRAPPPPRAEFVVQGAPVREQVIVTEQRPQVVREQVVVTEAAPQEVIVQTRPPAEQIEVIPVAPSAEHLWIKGNWHWDGRAWVWHPGHYETRRMGFHWVPAHYDERGSSVVYVGGHWAR